MTKFSLVLTTIHRRDELANFLAHLENQTCQDFELFVVDQNEDHRLDEILARFQTRLSIQHLHSERGVSAGRNKGLLEAKGKIIGFPDDDCWYPADLLMTVSEIFGKRTGLDGIVGRIIDPAGVSFTRYPRGERAVTPKNVFECSASAGCFLSSQVVRKVGTFDVQLGLGAISPWQGTEDTDYVLRAIKYGFHLEYDPNVIVYHPSPTIDIGPGTLQRAYAYGAGMGRVLKKHEFPLWRGGYYFIRPLGGAIMSMLKGDQPRAKYYLNNLRGRWDGWRSS